MNEDKQQADIKTKPELAAEGKVEQTLDPENWEDMRALAHRMVDDAVDYLQTVAERPAWRPLPARVSAQFAAPMPRQAAPAEQVYEEFLSSIMPYPMGNIHPRFWAWYMGSGTIMGALADFLAATMNSNVGAGNHAAKLVEEQVVNWMKELIGFPQDASGLLVGGASMANLVGLTVARNMRAGFDVRSRGLQAGDNKLVVYTSTEVHSCNQKAVELLGMGSDSLRKVPVDADYKLNIDALEAAIAEDRREGRQPICVIATAGTVNTGAIDPLNEVADLCARERLWFHIDGAIGAVAMLAPEVKPLLSGIQRADSIALDLHKWMHVPFEAGCALIRDRAGHRSSFSVTPEYLSRETRGLAGGEEWFSDYGIELSRGFRALKVWMSLKEHGVDRYGQLMSQNIAQAKYLESLVQRHKDFQLMAPVSLDIVCFRYRPAVMSETALDKLNRDILIALQEQGIAVPSYTTVNGKGSLRVAIANHRSKRADFDLLIREISRLGELHQ